MGVPKGSAFFNESIVPIVLGEDRRIVGDCDEIIDAMLRSECGARKSRLRPSALAIYLSQLIAK